MWAPRRVGHRRWRTRISISVVRTSSIGLVVADAHVAPPFHQADAFVELDPAGELIALRACGGARIRCAWRPMSSAGCRPSSDDLVVGVGRGQHRHEVIVELRRYEAKFDGARRSLASACWGSSWRHIFRSAAEVRRSFAVLGRGLTTKGRSTSWPSISSCPACGDASRCVWRRSRPRASPRRQAIRGRLAGNHAADVGGLLADGFAGVRLGLDPVNECGESTVRAVLRGRPAKFHRNGLGHERLSAFPAPFGRLIERSSCERESPVLDSCGLYVRKSDTQGKT